MQEFALFTSLASSLSIHSHHLASPLCVHTLLTRYVGCDQTDVESSFYALDANTGALAWKYSVGNVAIWSTAKQVDETLVVFGDQTGNVWALALP
jgi:outer membrane protein assembly factor BamB